MISKLFIDRPIVSIVISIVMVIVGAVAMFTLPTAQFPDIVPPEIRVQATYPGAEATTLEQSVATPIESQMSGVDHMNYMYSTNANNGDMVLTVNFDVKTEPNTDQILTQLRASQATAQLPPEVNTNGVVVQQSYSAPLVFLSLFSPKHTYDENFLINYVYINIADELSRVPGVGRVQVFGGQYAMRIWVKPDKLAKLGMTVPQIVSALQAQNKVNPSGQIGGEPVPKGQEFTYTVRSQGRLTTPEEFGEVVIRANPDGSILRLKDVARVELGAQNFNFRSRYNGQPSAGFAVYQLPGSNAVAAAEGIRAKMEELKRRFPNDVDYTIPLDTTKAVTAGMHEIVITLFEALVLVVIVVYLFLQSWRATLIPLLAVPVSLVGTFVVFPLLGFSINTLSLFGLVLAIGLVVDDAIVVVEAVEHNMEKGLSAREASIKAMQDVSGPVIAIALILAAVFIPTAFIPGITGRLYQQFAVTIAISVIFSAFNALTLSPALSALLLKPRKKVRGPLGRFFDWFNQVFGRATDGYITYASLAIRRSAISLAVLAVIALIGVAIGRKLPTSFLPEEDQGYLFISMQLPEAASLQRTGDAAANVEKIIEDTPGVDSVVTVNGFNLLSSTQTTNNAIFFVSLKDWEGRKSTSESAAAIQQRLSAALMTQIKDGLAFVISPPAIPGIGSSGGVTFVLQDRSSKGGDFLAQNVDKFLAAVRKRPEIASAITTYAPHVPQVYVKVDREKVLRQNVNLSDVYQTMQSFMGGYLVNYFNRFGRQWQVYVGADGEYRTKPTDIGQFYVTNSNGEMVPLTAVTDVSSTNGPDFTMRYNEYASAQIFASAAPGVSSGQAIKALEETFAQTMPSEMAFDYMGMSYQEQLAAKGVPPAAVFGLSTLFVFLILAALYESWTLPFSVLLGTPIAIFGAYATLALRHMENNVYAQIGLVMLIGLAAKNAILIVEFAKLEYEKGKGLVDAALTGARLRLRPILMTSFAFILGVLPLYFATGAGRLGRHSVGTAIVGGMLFSTILNLIFIPVLYVILKTMLASFSRKKSEVRSEQLQAS